MAFMIVTSSPLPPWIMQVTQLPLAACSKIRRAYKSVSFLWVVVTLSSEFITAFRLRWFLRINWVSFFSKRGRNSNAIFFFQMVQNSFDKTVTPLKAQQKHAQSRVTSVRWISNSFTLQFSEFFANAVIYAFQEYADCRVCRSFIWIFRPNLLG